MSSQLWAKVNLPDFQYNLATYYQGQFILVTESHTITLDNSTNSIPNSNWTSTANNYLLAYGANEVLDLSNNQTIPLPYTTNGYSCLGHGQHKFLAVSDSDSVIAESLDGTLWSTRHTDVINTADAWISVAYGDGIWAIASSTNRILVNEELHTVDFEFKHVIYADGRFIALDKLNFLRTSIDCITWAVEEQIPFDVSTFCYGNGRYLIIVDNQVYVKQVKFLELWTWGNNDHGALGDGTIENRSVPMQPINSVSDWHTVLGGDTTGAVDRSGHLWLCGSNRAGQQLNGKYHPKLGLAYPILTPVDNVIWKQVSTGYYHGAGLLEDDSAWAWGFNENGQLGNSETDTWATSIVPVTAEPGEWQIINCGRHHTAGIKHDGTLWLWGWNDHGQLGDGTIANCPYPKQTVLGGNDWASVWCTYGDITAAIKTNGTLWIWGRNNFGQCGTGDNKLTTPAEISIGGNNWISVSSSKLHTAALRADGTLWTWGRNDNGQLGDGTTETRFTPKPIEGNDWAQVVCGTYHTVAIKRDGTLWTWGKNDYGQLGTGNNESRLVPGQTVVGGNNWISISAGFHKNAAIRDSRI